MSGCIERCTCNKIGVRWSTFYKGCKKWDYEKSWKIFSIREFADEDTEFERLFENEVSFQKGG